MTNNQLPNVFATGGGYRCRHQWVIAIEDLSAQQARKPKPDSPKRRIPTRQDAKDELGAKRTIQARQTRAKKASAAVLVGRTQSVRATVRDTLANVRKAKAVRNV